ncbi:hypothetical protein GQ55_7G052900 [Panicum hallii var. hallii]|uniref:Uncharacterized protein n=1 Tax=Panicum hallii var. hallii TaxID=1504633 RepID=A0A2T7CST4_9POAL|nr:hypothetical protein GQ55_7G052900 [Panicum hallii var. hallii]
MLNMNGIPLFIFRAKPKQAGKSHVHSILDPLGRPKESNLPCIIVERGMKLSKDLTTPTISKVHDVIEPKLLALCNRLIEKWIVELLKVCPINVLARDNRCLSLAQDHGGVEVLMELASKSSFQIFCLLILIHILLACISQCHGLFEVIFLHFNRKTGQNLRTGEFRAPGILALIYLKLYLQTWRCARADFPSNSLLSWICEGRRRHGHAWHHVRSFPRCTRWSLVAAGMFLVVAIVWLWLLQRRTWRRYFFLFNLRIMTALFPTLTRWFTCSPHFLDKRCDMIMNESR